MFDPNAPGSLRIAYQNSTGFEIQVGRAGEALLRVGAYSVESEVIVRPPVGTRLNFVMHRGELFDDEWCEVTDRTDDVMGVAYDTRGGGWFRLGRPGLYCSGGW